MSYSVFCLSPTSSFSLSLLAAWTTSSRHWYYLYCNNTSGIIFCLSKILTITICFVLRVCNRYSEVSANPTCMFFHAVLGLRMRNLRNLQGLVPFLMKNPEQSIDKWHFKSKNSKTLLMSLDTANIVNKKLMTVTFPPST